jgi:hypothetical protein
MHYGARGVKMWGKLERNQISQGGLQLAEALSRYYL